MMDLCHLNIDATCYNICNVVQSLHYSLVCIIPHIPFSPSPHYWPLVPVEFNPYAFIIINRKLAGWDVVAGFPNPFPDTPVSLLVPLCVCVCLATCVYACIAACVCACVPFCWSLVARRQRHCTCAAAPRSTCLHRCERQWTIVNLPADMRNLRSWLKTL